MKYWTIFDNYNFIVDKKTGICEDIFTFDIETTSLIKYNDKFYPGIYYDKLTDDEKELTESCGFMYIWQFGINENVYYGRTWDELETFLKKINTLCNSKKIIYVHNLSFEFQFLRNQFKFKKVFARTMRHILKCELEYYNFEFRCSLMLSNVKLAKLSDIYKLPVAKLEGDLDYNVIRTNKTKMTMRELGYCENDCLVLYHYIKLEKETNKKVPMTFTGHVRNDLKSKLDKKYKFKMQKEIDSDPIIYNRLVECFAGRIYTRKLADILELLLIM